MNKPKIGNDIYIDTSIYVSHGKDDFHGGLCKIIKINKNSILPVDSDNYIMICVEENPGHSYNWNYLIENQEKWKIKFGETRGYQDPDDRLQFNIPWDDF